MWSPALHLPSFHLQILYALLMLNAMTFQLLRHSSSFTIFLELHAFTRPE